MRDYGTEERRKFTRENIHAPVQYEHKAATYFGSTMTRDISEGGIRIVLDNFLPHNTELKFKINLKEMPMVINTLGSIVWSQHLPHSNRYQFGVEFDEIDENYRRNLHEYLRGHRLKTTYSI